jgi:hypothetical protein
MRFCDGRRRCACIGIGVLAGEWSTLFEQYDGYGWIRVRVSLQGHSTVNFCGRQGLSEWGFGLRRQEGTL